MQSFAYNVFRFMKTKQIPYLVDLTLTPSNAVERGYEFVDEVFNPYVAIKEVISLAEERGYQFGTSINGDDIQLGLYRRIDED